MMSYQVHFDGCPNIKMSDWTVILDPLNMNPSCVRYSLTTSHNLRWMGLGVTMEHDGNYSTDTHTIKIGFIKKLLRHSIELFSATTFADADKRLNADFMIRSKER